MRKALMIASLTAFAASAAFAAPRNVDAPAISSTEEEIVVNPNDDGAVSDFTKPVDENSQGFGRVNKQKRAKR